MLDHLADLCRVIILRAEIRADPVFECLCLADINYFVLCVFHKINARRFGQSH